MRFVGDIYISEILHKVVLDRQGEEAGKLVDVVAALGDLFPRISGLVVKRGKSRYFIAWEDVSIFNRKVVSTSKDVEALGPHTLGDGEILACKTLLDKQIVDINGAKVVRVNDLKLGEVKGSLCLMAADVGVSGLFRRMGIRKRWDTLARLLGYKTTTDLISWNFLQPLEPKVSRLTLTVPRQQLSSLHPADIAEIISGVAHRDRRAIMESLDIEAAAEAMHELEPNVQAAIITQMNNEQAADILEAMPPDEAADLVGDLSDEKAQDILRLMESEEAEDVQELMTHEDDTAGGLMTTEYISFLPDMTVEDALREYRLEAPDVESASAHILFVADCEERLMGEVYLKDLVLAPPGKQLTETMRTDFRTVPPDEDEMEVARIISKYNLLALPVVGDDRRLLGIVTVDDVVDLVLPPQSRRRKHRIG